MTAAITMTSQISDETIRGLLCDAFEGGSDSWIKSARYELTDGLTYEDFCKNGSQQLSDDYWHPLQLVPLTEGCAVIVKDNEDGLEHRVDRASIHRGLQLMAEKYPDHFADVLSENDDANTGDIFLQLVCFGEVVFG